MTTNPNDPFGPVDSSDSSAMDAANQFNPALSGSAMSTSPYVSGSNVAGEAYSPSAGNDLTAGNDLDSFDSGDESGGAAWLKNVNTQRLGEYTQQAGQWVRTNPNAAVAIVAGIVATVFGILAITQASGRRRGNAYQYPNGQTYGQPYGNESVTYDPATHTETIHASGNAGYDNTGL